MKKKNLDEKSKKILFLQKALRLAAVLILRKYRPKIVAITGSVGKTSSKEAIFSVLSKKFRVGKNEKNYNNEIGLPLTIIGAEGGESSLWKWLAVFFRALKILIFPVSYPEVLVLEMGADRPGDIKYLVSFIQPDMSVITDISGSHLEYFKTIDRVAREKWTLVEALGKEARAAVNLDNPVIGKLFENDQKEGRQFLTYGFNDKADIQAKEVFLNYAPSGGFHKEIQGLSFKLGYKGATLPVRLMNILGEHLIYAALAGVAVGLNFKMNLVEIAAALENFSVLPGRMKLIPGIKNISIIDDTYNSSPVSSVAALEMMGKAEALRKIVVMGDMLELGAMTEEGHRQVAKKFLESKSDIFLAVGRRMKFAADELKKRNINPEKLLVFRDPISARKKLVEIIRPGDLVLIKGSQGMRMEKVVEKIMAEPQKASEILCRQSESWRNKPWKEV